MDSYTVEAYAQKTGLDLKTARERLEANYKREKEETDAKELSLKCIKAIRELSPKINGIIERESGYNLSIQEHKRRLDNLESKIASSEQVRAISVDLYKLEVAYQNLSGKLDRLIETVGKEINKPIPKPWYERLYNKIFNG